MKKVVSESGAVFGRALVDEDGGHGVPKIANIIIGVGARGKIHSFVRIMLFTCRTTRLAKISVFRKSFV
jgi:hypothetical protein